MENMENEEKELIENTNSLCNWNPSKGDPYTYSGCGIKSKRENIIGDIKLEITEKDNTKGSKLYSLQFNNNLKRIETFDFEQTKEIGGVDENGRLIMYPDLIDLTKPISVVLSYPFNKCVNVEINPSYEKIQWEDETTYKEYDIKHIGCLVWQIAKAYGIIYKTMDEEVGIWGHCFSDLYLESITILKNNKIELGIGS